MSPLMMARTLSKFYAPSSQMNLNRKRITNVLYERSSTTIQIEGDEKKPHPIIVKFVSIRNRNNILNKARTKFSAPGPKAEKKYAVAPPPFACRDAE